MRGRHFVVIGLVTAAASLGFWYVASPLPIAQRYWTKQEVFVLVPSPAADVFGEDAETEELKTMEIAGVGAVLIGPSIAAAPPDRRELRPLFVPGLDLFGSVAAVAVVAGAVAALLARRRHSQNYPTTGGDTSGNP